jgi:hypothetical protein
MRLYHHLKPRVVYELSQAMSKIQLSFAGGTTKRGKRGFLGVVAHSFDSYANLQDLSMALSHIQASIQGWEDGCGYHGDTGIIRYQLKYS